MRALYGAGHAQARYVEISPFSASGMNSGAGSIKPRAEPDEILQHGVFSILCRSGLSGDMCSDCKPSVLLKTRTLLAGNARFFFSLKALSMDATGSIPFPKSLCDRDTVSKRTLWGHVQ